MQVLVLLLELEREDYVRLLKEQSKPITNGNSVDMLRGW